MVGHPYVLAVSNATLALWMVFRALEIRDADIITTPYTWGGSLAGFIWAGNRPVFADIDRDTLALDPESVLKRLTPETRAILAVDIYGYPCDGEALREIADEYGLVLIQDCAQSFGAYLGKLHTGRWADVAVFSLTFGKALFSGEGGIIVTRNEELFQRLVWQTQHPYRQLRDTPFLPANEMALNLRIHPLSAVWADAVFDEALSRVEVHRRHCLEILKFLKEEGIMSSKIPDLRRVKPSFHALTFEPCCEGEKIEKRIQARGQKYRVAFPAIVEPIYRHEVYRRLAYLYRWIDPHPCLIAEEQCKRRLRLIQDLKHWQC